MNYMWWVICKKQYTMNNIQWAALKSICCLFRLLQRIFLVSVLSEWSARKVRQGPLTHVQDTHVQDLMYMHRCTRCSDMSIHACTSGEELRKYIIQKYIISCRWNVICIEDKWRQHQWLYYGFKGTHSISQRFRHQVNKSPVLARLQRNGNVEYLVRKFE